jgi:asparagine synthase (glutamine-hydrolysing)
MSGICGIHEAGRDSSTKTVESMLDVLIGLGDHQRTAIAGREIAFGAALGWNFARPSTLNGVTVVADADLVNVAETARVLSLAASDASRMPVPELIARLYLSERPNFIRFLHGAFSFALWDERNEQLLLAIDRFGMKKLYWRQEAHRLLFASRISAIRAVQNGRCEIDPTAILQFLLFSAVPAPLTSDRGIHKLQPGTLLTLRAGNAEVQQYWDIDYSESADGDVSRWSRELQNSMRAAVLRNLEDCDTSRTGCFLSGGTDSSSVVALASEVHKPVKSFSIAFEESGFSEIDFARIAATAFQTSHHEKFLVPQDACDVIDRVIAYYDEPFANSSAVGSYYCAALAREHGVDTLLAGDGGDELFGGNDRYASDRRFAMYGKLPNWLRRGVIEPTTNCLPDDQSLLALPRRYVRRAKLSNPLRILSYGFFLSTPPRDIFETGFLEQVGLKNWLSIPEAHYSRAKASSELNRILYLDVKMTLGDNDLPKVSGTAEMAGVRVRYPLLDDELATFSGRIPSFLKLRGFQKRYIFKQAMKGILPEKILYKKKHGFGVPVAQWLIQDVRMKELMNDMLHEPRTRQRGYFQAGFYERLMALHHQQPNFYGEIVWYLLALELWHRRHMELSREAAHAL